MCIMVLWTCGPVDLWTCGPADMWTCGYVDLWTCGPVDRLIHGSVDLWTVDLTSPGASRRITPWTIRDVKWNCCCTCVKYIPQVVQRRQNEETRQKTRKKKLHMYQVSHIRHCVSCINFISCFFNCGPCTSHTLQVRLEDIAEVPWIQLPKLQVQL